MSAYESDPVALARWRELQGLSRRELVALTRTTRDLDGRSVWFRAGSSGTKADIAWSITMIEEEVRRDKELFGREVEAAPLNGPGLVTGILLDSDGYVARVETDDLGVVRCDPATMTEVTR